MLAHEYDTLRQLEDTYWWYRVLRETVADDLAGLLGGQAAPRLLDAGCGTGGMLAELRARGPAWRLAGLDLSTQAVERTRARDLAEVVQGSVDALPFDRGAFDAVTCLDVLYAAGVDDRVALREFHRVLRPGGHLVLNVAAFEILRGRHDTAVDGARRYTPAAVSRLLAEAGFAEARVHAWNAWLFVPILGWRLLSRALHPGDRSSTRSDLAGLPAPLNAALLAVARLDMAVCRHLHLKVGTSVYAVARKPAA